MSDSMPLGFALQAAGNFSDDEDRRHLFQRRLSMRREEFSQPEIDAIMAETVAGKDISQDKFLDDFGKEFCQSNQDTNKAAAPAVP